MLEEEHCHEWSGSGLNAEDVVAGDVDGDREIETITVGWVEASTTQGQFTISTWDGSSFNVEKTELFLVFGMETKALGMDVGDVGGYSSQEIVITGTSWDMGENYFAWVQVYRWDGARNPPFFFTRLKSIQAISYVQCLIKFCASEFSPLSQYQ